MNHFRSHCDYILISCKIFIVYNFPVVTEDCSNSLLFMLQGKGLFAKRSMKKGETIFIERPLVSAQFLWNTLYKYKGEMFDAHLCTYREALIVDVDLESNFIISMLPCCDVVSVHRLYHHAPNSL